jgi:hypothetical protein
MTVQFVVAENQPCVQRYFLTEKFVVLEAKADDAVEFGISM